LGTGCGFVSYLVPGYDSEPFVERDFGLGPNATVFQAEVTAITEATRWAATMVDYPDFNREIVIYVDSQAAIQSLCANRVRSRVVENCIESLNEIGRVLPVTIRWIKAHVGHEGNERADRSARLGADNGEGGEKLVVPNPVAYLRSLIKDHICKVWEEYWQQYVGCRQSKFWMSSVKNDKRTATFMALDRKVLGKTLRWVTGHNFLRRHNSIVDPTKSPTCRLCGDAEETAIHVIRECPGTIPDRVAVYGEPFLADGNLGSVKDLVAFIQRPKISEMETEEDLPPERADEVSEDGAESTA
jgi:ribonuclease HI